jgi:hypothetical protein
LRTDNAKANRKGQQKEKNNSDLQNSPCKENKRLSNTNATRNRGLLVCYIKSKWYFENVRVFFFSFLFCFIWIKILTESEYLHRCVKKGILFIIMLVTRPVPRSSRTRQEDLLHILQTPLKVIHSGTNLSQFYIILL